MKKIEIRDITEKDVWQRLPLRVQDSHKGTYGKLLCVAGSSRYRGAAALTAEGALRGGCGIVTLASVEPVFASVQPRLPECILLCCEPDLVGGISEKNAGCSRENWKMITPLSSSGRAWEIPKVPEPSSESSSPAQTAR